MNKHRKISKIDAAKIERLYEKYNSIMYAEAYRILKDTPSAEDAVHQSFMKVMNNLNKVDEDDEIRTRSFLSIICRNVSFDIYNKRTKECEYIDEMQNEDSDTVLQVESGMPSPCDELISKETYELVLKEIEKLPQIYKDVIILERMHGYSKKEIANLLNISYDTVKKRCARAYKKLAEVLQKEELI